jgi:hypothetical protein
VACAALSSGRIIQLCDCLTVPSLLFVDRMLWSVASQREKMLNCQVVRAVALLLPVNQENVREQLLLQAVVKALATFTNHCSEECAQQVRLII